MVVIFLYGEFFIMSQVNAATTTPPLTVMCSSALTTDMTATMVFTSVELEAALGQHDMVLLWLLILRDLSNLSPRCLLKLMSIIPWALLRWVFLFKNWASHQFPYWCLLGCLLSDFRLQTFNMVLITFTLTPPKHRNWMHLLVSIMLLLLQSFQDSYAHLGPFLIIISDSILLASNLIN